MRLLLVISTLAIFCSHCKIIPKGVNNGVYKNDSISIFCNSIYFTDSLGVKLELKIINNGSFDIVTNGWQDELTSLIDDFYFKDSIFDWNNNKNCSDCGYPFLILKAHDSISYSARMFFISRKQYRCRFYYSVHYQKLYDYQSRYLSGFAPWRLFVHIDDASIRYYRNCKKVYIPVNCQP